MSVDGLRDTLAVQYEAPQTLLAPIRQKSLSLAINPRMIFEDQMSQR